MSLHTFPVGFLSSNACDRQDQRTLYGGDCPGPWRMSRAPLASPHETPVAAHQWQQPKWPDIAKYSPTRVGAGSGGQDTKRSLVENHCFRINSPDQNSITFHFVTHCENALQRLSVHPPFYFCQCKCKEGQSTVVFCFLIKLIGFFLF